MHHAGFFVRQYPLTVHACCDAGVAGASVPSASRRGLSVTSRRARRNRSTNSRASEGGRRRRAADLGGGESVFHAESTMRGHASMQGMQGMGVRRSGGLGAWG